MRAIRRVLVIVALTILAAPPARAGVNVERRGDENPMVEVARSTINGAMAGSVVGLAIALADKGGNDDEFVRWGFVGGTVVGLAWGIHFATTRPQPTALLRIDSGGAHLALALPEPAARGGARLDVVSLRF